MPQLNKKQKPTVEFCFLSVSLSSQLNKVNSELTNRLSFPAAGIIAQIYFKRNFGKNI